MLPLILQALRFRSINSAHQSVIDALAWLQAYRDDRCQFVACQDVPIDGVIGAQMQDLLLEEGPDSTERINRINYEIAVFGPNCLQTEFSVKRSFACVGPIKTGATPERP